MQVTTAATPTTNKTNQTAQLKLNTNGVQFREENDDKAPRSPLQREVREWQHIDPDTGALLTKRLEADRWSNGPSNKYGKVSNSQNIAQPNGTQQTKCKQLEILQAHTNNGHPVQVIRTLTSSRWSSTPVSPTIITTTEDSTKESHDLVHDVIEHHDDDDADDHGGRNGVKDESCNTSDLFYMHNKRTILKPNTTISPTKSIDETKTTTTTTTTTTTDRSWPTSQTTNNVGANCDAVSNKILEICEVSDTELNDVHDIDCNGIVTAVDDHYNNTQHNVDENIEHADDHDHEVYYRGKRVFDIAIHIESDTDTETERPQFQPHNNNNSNNNDNNNKKNVFNKIDNNNKRNSNQNSKNNSDNSKLFQKSDKTTKNINLNNVMNSSFSVAPTTTLNNNASTKTSNISLRAVVGDNFYNNTSIKNNHNQKTNEKTDVSTKNVHSTMRGTTLFEKNPTEMHKKESTLRNGNNIFIKSAFYGGNNNNKNNISKLISVKSCVGANAVVTNERSSDVDDQHDDQYSQQQQRKNSDIITHLTPTRQESPKPATCKNDFESFRLYDHGIDMPINSKHHNHETRPRQRSHSISTDDLSNDANEEENLSDWRRVTKLRRSFQSNSKASTPTNDGVETHFPQMSVSRRPSDLPTNSVSVARIRTELEQGHRLQTTTHNQNVDLNTTALNLNMFKSQEKETPTTRTNALLTAETLQEIRAKLKKLSNESLYKADYLSNTETTQPLPANIKLTDLNDTLNKTNSLATRQKYRSSIDSIDWQNRRKSYGFENMHNSEEKSNLRTDNSTDSGLGRSGDIANLSPLGEAPRSTIINFVPDATKLGSSIKVSIKPEKTVAEDLIKRHSIAVDASKYMANNTSKKPTQILEVKSAANDKSGKRVEFCKTEVHFAAESGRVNIVETDGKPPSTNNFRRRRRLTSASGPFQNLVKSATTATNNLNTNHNVAHFGSDQPIGTTLLTYRSSLAEQAEPMHQSSFISTTISNGNNDIDTDDISGIRGILKNKPIKPKPYHLGENISSADALWNLSHKSTVSLDTDNHTNFVDNNCNNAATSVAERVQVVEKCQEQTTKGYSTKINLNQSGISRRRLSIQEQLLQNLHDQEQHIDQGLKSAALILKTMQSASDFDQAMRRLSIASIDSIETNSNYTTSNDCTILQQLHRMYELHASRAEDSADEEVSSYFRDNSDIDEMNESIEYDNKIENQEFSRQSDAHKSNDISKDLQAPHLYTQNCAPNHLISAVLVSKPRTFFLHPHRPAPNVNEKSLTESLKIIKEARGARKLREHELSYFGVQIVNDAERSTSPKLSSSISTNNFRRASPAQRKSNIPHEIKNITKTQLRMSDQQQQNNWRWSHDKPDLLKHSTILNSNQSRSLRPKQTIGDSSEEHVYENINNEIITPSFNETVWTPYERKKDITRDTQILNEMSYNADKTLKAVSQENALKDQPRHSLRRPSTPLETISEKSKPQKVSNTCIAVKVSRNKSAAAAIADTASSLSRSSSFSSMDVCSNACSRSSSTERGGSQKNRRDNKGHGTYPRNYLTKSYNENHQRSSSLESRKSTADEKARKVCPTCHNTLSASDIRRDIEKSTSNKSKAIASTTHSSSRERTKCTTDQQKLQQKREPTSSQRKVPKNSSDMNVRNRGEDSSVTQNSFRKLTTALGLSKPSVANKSKVSESQHKEIKSRGVASRSTHMNQERHLTPTAHENRKTRNDSKAKKTTQEHTHSSDALTHGKNNLLAHKQSQRHHDLYDYKPQVVGTSTTTTKIAAKHQRERSVKDRK